MRTVHVRAVPREGHKHFCRGGHRFPTAGRTVTISDELYAVLRREELLAVEPADDRVPEPEPLELNDNRFDDRAHNASAAARESVERLKAEKAALEAQGEAERLRKEVDDLKAQLAAKAAKAEKPKADTKG